MVSRFLKFSLFILAILSLFFSVSAQRNVSTFFYGGDAAGTRYSKLKQINRTNVQQLEIAWQYDEVDGSGDSQNQPVIANGILYGVTPKHKLFALDAASGKELWRFDSGLTARGPNRGVTFWSQGNEQRIFFAMQNFVYAIDPKTGKTISSFGTDGRIDLREGLGRDPGKVTIAMTTPGVVYKDVIDCWRKIV